MSVDVFNTRKNICCGNVPEMYLCGKISKKKKLLSALFSRVCRETGNTKFIPSSLSILLFFLK